MEPVKVFSGNEIQAGAVQYILNENHIGTWVRTTGESVILGEGDPGAAVEIYIEAEMESKAKLVLANNDYTNE